MNPPPKASKAKRADNRPTTPRERCRPNTCLAADSAGCRHELDGWRKSPEHDRQRQTQPSIGQNHWTINDRSDRPDACPAGDQAGDKRSDGGSSGTDQVVPGEDRGSPLRSHNLGECGLFDREKRPHFIAAGTDHPDGGGQ